jgi:dTDP-4-dehydrorhamnose reductase
MQTAPSGWAIAGLSRKQLDITDTNAVRFVINDLKPELIINAAAYTAVDRAEQEPDLAQRINADAVAYLAAGVQGVGGRLVHVSTDFVFDGMCSRPYRPEDEPAPLSIYGHSKLEGEHIALDYPGNLIIRTAWVYGVHGVNFVKTMLRMMKEKDELRVVADQIGTPTHVNALARTTWNLLQARAEGIFHVTDAGVASWYDFAVAIQAEALDAGLLERAIPITPIASSDYPTPARRPFYGVLDKTETWRLLGHPARHWRDELRLMIKELREISIV